MKTILSLLLIVTLSNLTLAQTTAIPDPNFEQVLIDLGLDDTIDGVVLTANIDTLTYLDVYKQSISDLTGIENFTALTYLLCDDNSLTSIDVSQNLALTYLSCGGTEITSIDVSQNTALITLRADTIDVLSVLNVSGASSLTYLSCEGANITSLDVSQNTALTFLNCNYVNLTSLDVSQNTLLTSLECYNNQLTSLDVSQNTLLTSLWCENNQLTCLNVKNGNNTNFTTFFANYNPNLTCIEVDDVAYSTTNWVGYYYYSFDSTSSFSTNCGSNCSPTPCSASSSFTYTNNGNGNYTFTNTSTSNFNQTHWAFGDGFTSTSINPNHSFSTNGTFIVVLTINDSTNGGLCIDYFMDTITVTGVTSPLQCVSGFVIYPDTATGNITVVNSSTGTNLTYLWSFGDGDTSTLQFPNHTYATSGPFYLCLTVDDGVGCNDMYCDSIGGNGVVFNKQAGFTINVISPPIITGIDNNLELNSEVNIYPNPTSNLLSIETELDINEINIIDITGKMIITTKQNTNTINVVDLSNGIYFIKLITDEKTIIKKIVKQ